MPEANDAIDVCREITEITVSVDRKISDGNFGSAGIFVSAKVVVPRHGNPDVLAEGLYAWVKGQVEAGIAKATGKEPEKKPDEKVEDKKEVPPAGEGAGTGASGGAGAEEIPVCPIHSKAMRKGKYGWYCPTKIGDGPKDYCKHKA